MSDEIRWHYTHGLHARLIVNDGAIGAATRGMAGVERPAVWFSINPTWENTASKGDESGCTLDNGGKWPIVVEAYFDLASRRLRGHIRGTPSWRSVASSQRPPRD